MNKKFINFIKFLTFIVCITLFSSSIWGAGSLQQFNDDLQRIADRVLPTVVSISSERGERGGFPFGPSGKAKALGSGVIIDKRGYIVTNNHVIEGADNITVTLSDKREFKSALVGADPSTDIAVIKISGKVPSNLPVISFADSDRIRPGQITIAVGNAFGFSNTITMGIVSAVNRQNLGLLDYESLIQTDAAINPGNSGGALVNIDGQLIGINTAIYSRSGGSDGLGFAIPSNQVVKISDELIKHGKIERGWIGVLIQDLTEDLALQKNLSVKKGVVVTSVEENSPAGKAGIRVNDIITAINNKSVTDVDSLRKEVADIKPGVTVDFGILRGNKRTKISVRIGKMPDARISLNEKETLPRDLGIVVSSIDEDSSYRYRITDRNGVVIQEVRENSPASRSGLEPGDVIKTIEGEPVSGLEQYNYLLERYGAHRRLQLHVSRRNRLVSLTLLRGIEKNELQ